MKKELFDKNPVLKLSFDFALMVIEYCEHLEQNKKYIISRQLLKSGTSIGANAMEAPNAESKADFIHKMRIAAKKRKKHNFGYGYVNTVRIIKTVTHSLTNWTN